MVLRLRLKKLMLAGVFCFLALFALVPQARARVGKANYITKVLSAPNTSIHVELEPNDPRVKVEIKGWYPDNRGCIEQVRKTIEEDLRRVEKEGLDYHGRDQYLSNKKGLEYTARLLLAFLIKKDPDPVFPEFFWWARWPIKFDEKAERERDYYYSSAVFLDPPPGGSASWSKDDCYTRQELASARKELIRWVNYVLKVWLPQNRPFSAEAKLNFPRGRTITISATRKKKEQKIKGKKVSEVKSGKEKEVILSLDEIPKQHILSDDETEYRWWMEALRGLPDKMFAEVFGLSGPVVVQGKVKRDVVVGFFDPRGVLIGHINKKQIKDNPQITTDYLQLAQYGAQAQLLSLILSASGADLAAQHFMAQALIRILTAMQYDLPLSPQAKEELNKRIKDLNQKIEQRKKLIGRKATGLPFDQADWQPETAVIFKQGIPEDKFLGLSQKINDAVLKGKKGKAFLDMFAEYDGSGYAGYSAETVFDLTKGRGEEVVDYTHTYPDDGPPSAETVFVGTKGGGDEIADYTYSYAGDQGKKEEVSTGPPSAETVFDLTKGRGEEVVDYTHTYSGDHPPSAETFFDGTKGAEYIDYIYTYDYIYPRRVQLEPNDPLYFKTSRRRSRGSSGGFKIGLGGLSMGGVSIGKSKKGSKSGAQDQWGIRYVGFKPKAEPDSAWNIEDGKEKNVIVAVIDSGLDKNHPDGPEYLWQNPDEIPDNGIDDDNNGYIDDINGWNFIQNNNDLTDYNGHGTFVAGIIAAKRNNAKGIAGINPGAQIMVLKAVNEKGLSNSLNIWRALRYAADKRARIINISLGDRGISVLEQLGINYAYSKGAFIVVAAGNQADNLSLYGPPALRRAFVVGALNIEGTRSVINNRGANLALLAPGEDIYSLHSQDAEWQGPSMAKERLYSKRSGTSFSAPIVAATASLLLAKNPELTNQEIEDILLATAANLKQPGWDSDTGAGVLDAYEALRRSPHDLLTIKPTELVINRKKNKVNSIDLLGIIRGDLDSYKVLVGRGKKPKKWEEIAQGEKSINYGQIAHIEGKPLKGKYCHIRIIAKDKAGRERLATVKVALK